MAPISTTGATRSSSTIAAVFSPASRCATSSTSPAGSDRFFPQNREKKDLRPRNAPFRSEIPFQTQYLRNLSVIYLREAPEGVKKAPEGRSRDRLLTSAQHRFGVIES